MQILSAARTDIGPRKEVNQDSFFAAVRSAPDIPAGIFAVADGVSGSSHGEVASRLCAEAIGDWWERTFPLLDFDKSRMIPSLAEAIIGVNQTVRETKVADGGRSSSTLTVLLLCGDEWFTFNAGDSRIYRLKRGLMGRLEQLTEDQSCLVEREYNGKKYMKSVLTNCVGGRNAFQYGYTSGTLSAGDRFALCSDGVYKTQTDRQIQRLLGKRRATPESVCENLVSTALTNGETDNITAITVFC